MLIHFLPPVAIALTAGFAIWSAREEAQMIRDRINHDITEDLDHAPLLRGRLVALAVLLVPSFLAVWWTGTPMWGLLAEALMCAGTFAVVHRWKLNREREEPWWYMGARLGYRKSGASRYDQMWHWIAWRLSGGKRFGNLPLRTIGAPVYSQYLPARLAYTFETLTTIAGAVWFYWMTRP